MMLDCFDSFSKCKTKEEVISCYLNQLKVLEKVARDEYEIGSNEFYEFLYTEVNSQNENAAQKSKSIENCTQRNSQIVEDSQIVSKCSSPNVYSLVKRYAIYIAILAITIYLVNNSSEVSRIFMRNIQPFIYPVMRFWRKITIPIITIIPELTDLYDETCLVPNPFFRVTDLDCSPCADVVNVVDLTMSAHLKYFDNSIPHIIQMNSAKQRIAPSIAQLYLLYHKNRKSFRDNAYKVQSSSHNVRNLDQMFDVLLNRTEKYTAITHNLWRINRMTPARILRPMFPVPEALPQHAAIGVERYIAIDTGGGVTYQIPSTDCSNMFVYQAMGARTIHLQPTAECENQCRRLSIRLKQNSTLFYDWWYWKPISSSADQFSNAISMTYIGSYC